MLKKKISYTDYNGKEQTESFYFNMNEREVVLMLAKLGTDDIKAYTEKLVADGDAVKMFAFVDQIILDSVGKKSDDGKRFIKTKAYRDEFEESEAYNALFMQFLSDPKLAQSFASGIVAKASDSPITGPTLKTVDNVPAN